MPCTTCSSRLRLRTWGRAGRVHTMRARCCAQGQQSCSARNMQNALFGNSSGAALTTCRPPLPRSAAHSSATPTAACWPPTLMSNVSGSLAPRVRFLLLWLAQARAAWGGASALTVAVLPCSCTPSGGPTLAGTPMPAKCKSMGWNMHRPRGSACSGGAISFQCCTWELRRPLCGTRSEGQSLWRRRRCRRCGRSAHISPACKGGGGMVCVQGRGQHSNSAPWQYAGSKQTLVHSCRLYLEGPAMLDCNCAAMGCNSSQRDARKNASKRSSTVALGLMLVHMTQARSGG